MKRRQFLKRSATGFAVAAAGVSLASPAIAKQKKILRMVTTWPKNFPGMGTSAERLATRVNAMSGGSLHIAVSAAGELVPPFESFDAVSSGIVDMYHAWEYYWQSKTKAFAFFAAVPFGLNASEMNAWINHGGGQRMWDELSAGFNLKPFLAGNTGMQMGGWFNKEVSVPEDFKGLKIRMPGLGGDVLRRIGAAAVALPGGDVIPSLKSGDIDAAEWIGPWSDMDLGFHRVAKYYYYPGFHEPGTAIAAVMNRKVWEGLSTEHKAIITAATAAENGFTLDEFNARNSTALDVLRNQHQVEMRKFSNEILQAVGEAAGDVVAAAGASDSISKKVYREFMDFRKKSIAWSRRSEQAFSNARGLPFDYG